MSETQTSTAPDLAELDRRIRFDDTLQIMEADFSGFHFDSSEVVNRFYDRLEHRIKETGEELWFFLVNLNDTRIDPTAWTAYSRRGRALNMAHSMGSVRFDASDITRRQIERAANTEAFDPNLFSDRDAAIARIKELPSKRRKRLLHEANHSRADFVTRLSFDPATVIMDVDFSHFTFHHSKDVNDFYDYIEERIKESDRKWFFLVDMNACQILPAAWIQYAHRGKRLNIAASLGSVRYAAGSETEADIRLRAESQGFRPNIRNTRQEALELIEELRAELMQG
ncbi:hypothetical protein SAMN05444414_11535 [Roseovarius marisflavi]|uniref:Uncharacterized protein n=1 Tax=Roseovarius marisflavi TaxID=1054996 RepID=A0A1M7AVZ7_9RHOB|nr:hypothetical protein [Roseovarius marisflavi]SHL46861.1 hypothetical protein SAMN05444414_11535 [Roseovarius marisflavi]